MEPDTVLVSGQDLDGLSNSMPKIRLLPSHHTHHSQNQHHSRTHDPLERTLDLPSLPLELEV